MSGQSATDFYARVTTVNADYIDSSGRTGQMDMPVDEYKAMTEKTHDKKNAEALENAKELFNKRKVGENIPVEKVTEYYAVRQGSNKKFNISSISADGLVTVLKPNIVTIAEAKKAMLQIYEAKKNDVRCELIHPQTLDEKSAEMFKNREKGLPEVTYRIFLNKDKNASPDNTHYVQQYIKNDNDTYAIGQIVTTGDWVRRLLML